MTLDISLSRHCPRYWITRVIFSNLKFVCPGSIFNFIHPICWSVPYQSALSITVVPITVIPFLVAFVA